MKLFIAEKPSLGRAIADVLPKPHQKKDGYIEASNGDIVTWCIGHLLEQAAPEDYDPAFKKWQVEHLPIIPQQWQLKAKYKTKKQLGVVRKLIKSADVLVNAGDVDREGQILVDEVISFCKASKSKVENAQRCLISDMNFNAVKKSVSNLKLNKQFIPLAVSALARARADWIYGLNMTRLCTLQGQKSGYQGVLSIGRVQTPILGLIVNRDLNIESFVSKPFYEVEAFLQTEKREVFVGKWKPSEACQPYMDAENRVLSKPLAQNVVDRITQKTGKIINIDKNNQQQPPPLPFSLSSLQISAAKAFGMSAKQVLDICQQLYERHKLITYPRSDCQYLPKEHLKEAASVTSAIAAIAPDLASTLNTIDLKKKSRAWDDKKVSAHHAIIPTSRSQKSGSLSATEIKVYGLIAKQYLAQFFPNHRYAETSVTSEIEGGTFLTKQKQILDLGWKSLLFSEKSNRSTNASADAKNNSNNAKNQSLPADLKVGDSLFCHSGEVLEKNTSPPKHFTDATLLSALTGIGRYVTDPAIKKSLRETDGLGTEATRAGIIELLFKRQYIIRSGKDIKATEVGRKLITALPSQISQPDMTALWESQLESISQQTLNYKSFIGGVESNLHCLIEDVKKVSLAGLPAFTGKQRFNKKRSTTKKNTKAA